MQVCPSQDIHESSSHGSDQVCELMTDSAVQDNKSSSSLQLPEQSQISGKVPSIINNLEQAEYKPETRISELIHFHNNDLFEEEMKTLRTLGIIPQQKSEQSIGSKRCCKKMLGDDDDISTNLPTPQGSHATNKTDYNFSGTFPTQHQSLIRENAIVFRLKNTCSPEKGFSLFRNYSLNNKLEIVNDSYNLIVAKLKKKTNNLSTFIQTLKSIDGENNDVHLAISFMPAPRFLKLALTTHSKNVSNLTKYGVEFASHASSFKQYLWENNCIQVSQIELIELTLMKEKESIVEIKGLLKNMMKTNKNEIGLENCLLRTLEFRELLMYQIQQKGLQAPKCNPLLEIEKRLLEELDLYSIYKDVYSKDQERYDQRKQQIKSKTPISEIYSYLKISESDRLIDQQGQFPYDASLEQLDSFLSDPYPHLFLQKIERFYNSFQLNKTIHRRTSISREFQEETSLELVILCLLESNQRNTYHKIKFIEHYLRIVDNSRYERLCLNLALALDYIENSWEIN